MVKTITMRKFDVEEKMYTDEYYELSLEKFIKNFCLKAEHDITKRRLTDYAKQTNISINEEFKKPEMLDDMLAGMSDEEKLDMADVLGIGVPYFRFLEIGMKMEEYKEIFKNLKVVGKEIYKENKYRNLYSIRQYFEYKNKTNDFTVSTDENGFLDIPDNFEGLPFA